ncbi:hypothetical protein C1H46_012413 [Malus baccata]|uniref:Uncharacterized protein n=1 Tax=Malus baccata TaxID=106549 RepID=A0A540MT67_MALBA|nr:hypothetical protein C1H46_012413 [Malus baccata]
MLFVAVKSVEEENIMFEHLPRDIKSTLHAKFFSPSFRVIFFFYESGGRESSVDLMSLRRCWNVLFSSCADFTASNSI